MKQATQLPIASSKTTTIFKRVISPSGAIAQTSSVAESFELYKIDDYIAPLPGAPEKYSKIGDLVEKWELDDERHTALKEARGWIADTFNSQDGDTIRTIRLHKGLSQAQLALEIGTSQPHIYRIERGTENISIETCRKLCRALEIDMNSLNRALEYQEMINLQKTVSK